VTWQSATGPAPGHRPRRDGSIDAVVAANRHVALELEAFHTALIPTSRRQDWLADWLQTV
jgi:hypothetical protein